jgi:feruloyl esterase
MLLSLARVFLGFACCALLASMAAAQTTPGSLPQTAAAKCDAFASEDFQAVPEAPTHLYSTKYVEGASRRPYCEVIGNIAPQVGFLMWLPAQNWNGKFAEVGCGGFCGMFTFMRLCDEPLAKGYACVTTDMGHKGIEAQGVEWAYNNPQAVIDFAYRATHVTAVAGKAIVARYYGQAPRLSYFIGCSCGGRQGLVEAERFPLDFNGIIVGAPALNYADIALTAARKARLLEDAGGRPLFDAAGIKLVADAVVAKCDLNDGVKDGLIGDPRRCRFDPRSLVCAPGAASDCLSAAQAAAIAAFYTEPHNALGERVGERAFLPGWEDSAFGLAVNTPLTKRSFYEDFLKYFALTPNPGPAWKMEDFDADKDYQRLAQTQGLMSADNPDLSRFSAAGGKLILYHGWKDSGPSPLGSIALYDRIEQAMGGRADTQKFLRLFMIPDMDHCMGGKGAWAIDYLDYLETWVERGRAPDMMIGSHVVDYPGPDGRVPDGAPQFTRPVFPYPFRAQYKGSGDPNDAANFKRVGAGG